MEAKRAKPLLSVETRRTVVSVSLGNMVEAETDEQTKSVILHFPAQAMPEQIYKAMADFRIALCETGVMRESKAEKFMEKFAAKLYQKQVIRALSEFIRDNNR